MSSDAHTFPQDFFEEFSFHNGNQQSMIHTTAADDVIGEPELILPLPLENYHPHRTDDDHIAQSHPSERNTIPPLMQIPSTKRRKLLVFNSTALATSPIRKSLPRIPQKSPPSVDREFWVNPSLHASTIETSISHIIAQDQPATLQIDDAESQTLEFLPDKGEDMSELHTTDRACLKTPIKGCTNSNPTIPQQGNLPILSPLVVMPPSRIYSPLKTVVVPKVKKTRKRSKKKKESPDTPTKEEDDLSLQYLQDGELSMLDTADDEFEASTHAKTPDSSDEESAPHTDKRIYQRWTNEEDELLRAAVRSSNTNYTNWKLISIQHFKSTRGPLHCKSRWLKAIRPGTPWRPWTNEEDQEIIEGVRNNLTWHELSQQLDGRPESHIRWRYQHFVNPDLLKSQFTPKETQIVFDAQQRLGNKWAEIAKLLPGRSHLMVKNRWHNMKNREERTKRVQKETKQMEAKKLEAKKSRARELRAKRLEAETQAWEAQNLEATRANADNDT